MKTPVERASSNKNNGVLQWVFTEILIPEKDIAIQISGRQLEKNQYVN